jgi:hypothetical protein
MSRRLHAGILVLALVALAGEVPAAEWPFTGQLEIRTSIGTNPANGQLLVVPLSGVAEIEAGVLKIPAGAISAPVPDLFGFGGTLMNAPGTFSPGGAGPGASCPLVELQEICIDGGGFGGSMRLDGLTQAGQDLERFGSPGTNVGVTMSGKIRTEAGTRWTQGHASVWFFIPEIDPTPFILAGVGSFRGLPSTFTGEGQAGLTLVTPMRVTFANPSPSGEPSDPNVRALARLRIDFAAEPVPIAAAVAAIVAALLTGFGVVHLRASQPGALLR